MQNLRITFSLETPAIFQSRFTTIDSILLSVFFQKYKDERNITNFIKIEDFLDEIGKFIEIKDGIISGSIWYKTLPEPIYRDDCRMFKSIRDDEYAAQGFFADNPVNKQRGQFKAYDLHFSILTIPKIYFYITGNKENISELLKSVHYFGKKRKIGFGFTDEEPVIEEIRENKGIFIDDTTVSKPVPCSKAVVKTHRVMFYRQYPPYWEKGNKVACYMPPMYYTEEKDISWEEEYQSLPSAEFISSTEFTYKTAKVKGEPPITLIYGGITK